MTLSEKIVRELRRKKDMGMTSDMLASALHANSSKVAVAAEALMEQEHLILGGDRCWYLGDAEAAGAAYVPAPEPELIPEVAPEPPPMEEAPDLTEETVREVLEQITPEMTMDPFGFQVKPPLAQKKPKALPSGNQFGKLPAWIRLKTWVETRSHHAMPISWTELSKELDIIKTTLGKARNSLLGRGDTELIAKLDRLVYREDSKSMRKRAGVEETEAAVPTPSHDPMFSEVADLLERINAPTFPLPPGPLADYLDLLQGFDDLCESQGLEPERLMRRRIAELMAWLRDLPQ